MPDGWDTASGSRACLCHCAIGCRQRGTTIVQGPSQMTQVAVNRPPRCGKVCASAPRLLRDEGEHGHPEAVEERGRSKHHQHAQALGEVILRRQPLRPYFRTVSSAQMCCFYQLGSHMQPGPRAWRWHMRLERCSGLRSSPGGLRRRHAVRQRPGSPAECPAGQKFRPSCRLGSSARL